MLPNNYTDQVQFIAAMEAALVAAETSLAGGWRLDKTTEPTNKDWYAAFPQIPLNQTLAWYRANQLNGSYKNIAVPAIWLANTQLINQLDVDIPRRGTVVHISPFDDLRTFSITSPPGATQVFKAIFAYPDGSYENIPLPAAAETSNRMWCNPWLNEVIYYDNTASAWVAHDLATNTQSALPAHFSNFPNTINNSFVDVFAFDRGYYVRASSQHRIFDRVSGTYTAVATTMGPAASLTEDGAFVMSNTGEVRSTSTDNVVAPAYTQLQARRFSFFVSNTTALVIDTKTGGATKHNLLTQAEESCILAKEYPTLWAFYQEFNLDFTGVGVASSYNQIMSAQFYSNTLASSPIRTCGGYARAVAFSGLPGAHLFGINDRVTKIYRIDEYTNAEPDFWDVAAFPLDGLSTLTVNLNELPDLSEHGILQLVFDMNHQGAASQSLDIQFNMDTTPANYSSAYERGSATAVTSAATDVVAGIRTALLFIVDRTAPMTVTLPNWSQNDEFKVALWDGSSQLGDATTNLYTYVGSGYWKSTAPITSITINTGTAQFRAGTMLRIRALRTKSRYFREGNGYDWRLA